jgi:hypothetical protein
MSRAVAFLLLLLTAVLAACGRADARTSAAARASATTASAATPLPSIAQQLAAFRRGMQKPHGLAGAYASTGALERAFAAALSAGDTAALARMTLDRAEFAWLYYPGNPRSLAPYELDPDLMWMQLAENGGRGMRRALRENAGHRVRVVAHGCAGPEERYGAVRVTNGCWISRAEKDRTPREVLHGGIVEYAGRYKLVSLANTL